MKAAAIPHECVFICRPHLQSVALNKQKACSGQDGRKFGPSYHVSIGQKIVPSMHTHHLDKIAVSFWWREGVDSGESG